MARMSDWVTFCACVVVCVVLDVVARLKRERATDYTHLCNIDIREGCVYMFGCPHPMQRITAHSGYWRT